MHGLKSRSNTLGAAHAAFMGRRAYEWQDSDYVLGYFGKQVGAARTAYL